MLNMTSTQKLGLGLALGAGTTMLLAAVAGPPIYRNYFTTNSTFTAAVSLNATTAYATNAANITNAYATNGVYATNIFAGGVAKAGISVTNRVSINGATTNIMVWQGGILVSNIANQ